MRLYISFIKIATHYNYNAITNRVGIAKFLKGNDWNVVYVRHRNDFQRIKHLITAADLIVVDIQSLFNTGGMRGKRVFMSLVKPTTKTVLLMGDVWPESLKLSTGFDLRISTLGYNLPEYGKNPSIYIPHHVSYKMSFPEKVQQKVLFPVMYDLKNAAGIKRYKSRIELAKHLRDHKGVEFQKESLKNDEYMSLLSSFVACITSIPSDDFQPNLVGKFYEICACGSLLMTYTGPAKTIFESQGFKDGENYIEVNVDNVDDKIDYVLDPKNTSDVNRIRHNGYTLVRETFTIENTMRVFMDALSSI